jgi:hypothetical protein
MPKAKFTEDDDLEVVAAAPVDPAGADDALAAHGEFAQAIANIVQTVSDAPADAGAPRYNCDCGSGLDACQNLTRDEVFLDTYNSPRAVKDWVIRKGSPECYSLVMAKVQKEHAQPS